MRVGEMWIWLMNELRAVRQQRMQFNHFSLMNSKFYSFSVIWLMGPSALVSVYAMLDATLTCINCY